MASDNVLGSTAPVSRSVYRSTAAPALSSDGLLHPYLVIGPDSDPGTVTAEKLHRAMSRPGLHMLVKDPLPGVNGFTASLDDSTVASLSAQGFTVISDEPDRFIPSSPLTSIMSGDPLQEMPASQRTTPRPELTQPRYDS